VDPPYLSSLLALVLDDIVDDDVGVSAILSMIDFGLLNEAGELNLSNLGLLDVVWIAISS
jgi:hypothetical protein